MELHIDHHNGGQGADKGGDGADRQVDMPGNDHQHHPDRQDEDIAVLQDQVGDVQRLQQNPIRQNLK
ncbi:hypothetical protein D1872_288080 [compost metagenome]